MVHFIGQKTLFFYFLPFEFDSSFAIFTKSGLGISSAIAILLHKNIHIIKPVKAKAFSFLKVPLLSTHIHPQQYLNQKPLQSGYSA